jgi:predicted metalloprotease with PDZ domain
MKYAAALALFVLAQPAGAQRRAATPASAGAPAASPAAVSAPIENVRYAVTFDEATAARRAIVVAMTFDVRGDAPVLLSLPAWTPGAYGMENFARYVTRFAATAGTRALDWDKLDHDTWRVRPGGARTVTAEIEYRAEMFDNSAAWAVNDFAFFNGTTVFLYPEGRGTDWGATVTVRLPARWRVATGMTPAGTNTFRESSYHDLVDMPFFVGHFDIDSVKVADTWVRLASYPAGAVNATQKQTIFRQLQAMWSPIATTWGETPFRTYTVLQVIDSAMGGYSGLEHQNSHLDLLAPVGLGSPTIASLYAHEIVHAWNVKRLRPAELWPYDYDEPQPTTLLWVSEGVTDYQADLAMVRSKLYSADDFYSALTNKVSSVDRNPPMSLEDASLDTWIKPVNGEYSIYYDKGAVVGLLLDIMIRDASDNRRTLDDVFRELYGATYKRGRGFTDSELWATVSRAAGGRSFQRFRERYVDGRDPLPLDSVLPLAGMRMIYDSVRVPQMGVTTNAEPAGVRVISVDAESAAEAAGVRAGDLLVRVGDIPIEDVFWGARFRAQYAQAEGRRFPILVRRDGREVTLDGTVRTVVRVSRTAGAAQSPGEKALRIRNGILTGTPAPTGLGPAPTR